MSPLPGLARNALTISRPANTTDQEGNSVGALVEIFDGYGTWGTPTGRDILRADQRGFVADAVVAMPITDVRPGDVAVVKDETWTVTHVLDVRTHQRVFLRRAE